MSTQRTTTNDVRQAAQRVRSLADELRLIPAANADGSFPELLLQEGSKTNGIAWRFYVRANNEGGVSGSVLGLSNGYLGMTKAEAFNTLQTVYGVLLAVKFKD